MDELLDKIANLIDGRNNESLHINVETARTLIASYINEYTDKNFERKSTAKQELEKLITEYTIRYPLGEFMASLNYSANNTHVEGIIGFDWKCQIYHIENEPIADVIKLIKGLKKSV